MSQRRHLLSGGHQIPNAWTARVLRLVVLLALLVVAVRALPVQASSSDAPLAVACNGTTCWGDWSGTNGTGAWSPTGNTQSFYDAVTFIDTSTARCRYGNCYAQVSYGAGQYASSLKLSAGAGNVVPVAMTIWSGATQVAAVSPTGSVFNYSFPTALVTAITFTVNDGQRIDGLELYTAATPTATATSTQTPTVTPTASATAAPTNNPNAVSNYGSSGGTWMNFSNTSLIDGQTALVTGTSGRALLQADWNNVPNGIELLAVGTGAHHYIVYRGGVQCLSGDGWGAIDISACPIAFGNNWSVVGSVGIGGTLDGYSLNQVASTATPTPTSTITPPPSSTPSHTPTASATATTPAATATFTPIPPTATNTATATATFTPVPPTATSVPSATPGPVSVGFSSTAFTVAEGADQAHMTVVLGSISPVQVRVDYATTSLTAIDGVRYSGRHDTLTFEPGETQKTIDLTIIDNLVRDGDQSLLLVLTNPTGNGVLGVYSASLTIVDNETANSVSGVSQGPDVHIVYPLANGNASLDVLGFTNTATVSLGATSGGGPAAPEGLTSIGGIVDVSLRSNGQPVSFVSATLCLPYSEAFVTSLGVIESQLALYHYDGSQWINITSGRDTTNDRVCGLTSSFSSFMIAGAAHVGANAQIDVYGASLEVDADSIVFGDITLNGIAQTSNGVTLPWHAKDPTGTGAGWHLSIAATDFVGPDSRTISVAGFKINLLDGDIHTIYGSQQPISLLTNYTALGAYPMIFLRAAPGTGMGHYTLQPTFTLSVPAETYAGQYVSVVTVAIIAGP